MLVFPMNRAIEFHDSTLKEVKIEGSNVKICFDKAYVHQSDGVPGLEKGTGWEQKINILLYEASVEKCPDDLPNDIDTGYIIVNNQKSINLLRLPLQCEGEIEIVLFTIYGKELRVKSKKLQTQELDKAIFLEDFPES
jgi:hypothetical protein